MMFSNYLKIALRSMRKHKSYTFINLLGFSTSIAAALLIGLYALEELQYDHFHENGEDIYMVYKERNTPTGVQPTYDTWAPLLDALRNDYPAIQNGSRTYRGLGWVSYGDERHEEYINYVDSSFFDVFSFKLKKGNAQKPFKHLYSAIISQEKASKYFGNEEAIGKTITIDHDTDYEVVGILDEIPTNSSLNPEILILLPSVDDYDDFSQSWNGSFLYTYIQLHPNSNAEELTAKFPEFITKIWDAEENKRTTIKLLPLLDQQDQLNDNRKYAYMLLIVTLAIILIACINYINLSTARTLDRSREVGMRKVLGAQRSSLIGQFLGESVIVCFISVSLGLLMAELFAPVFNQIFLTELKLDFWQKPMVILGLLMGSILLGVLAGIYPSLLFSNFKPIDSLRTRLNNSRKGLSARNVLVSLQFVFSIMLIVSTLVIYQQVEFMKHANMAFDKENLVVIPVELQDFSNQEVAAQKLERFKNELAQHSSVSSLSSSSHIPGNWSGWFMFAYPEGWESDNPMRVRRAFMDEKYFPTYGIKMLAGRNFRKDSEQDRQQSLILNLAAAEAFGWTVEDAVGKTVRVGRETQIEVVGVVDNYKFESLQNQVQLVLHFYRPPENGVHNFITAKIAGKDMSHTLSHFDQQWQTLDPSRSFEYFFVDENLGQLYETEERLTSIILVFAILAIVIACMGVFGLAAFTAEKRTKEISIRKVLGASTYDIILLMSKDITTLVLISFVIAAPFSFFLMQEWLSDFAYRMNWNILVFILGGFIPLVIAWSNVGFHALKLAYINPAESLKDE